MTSIFVWKFLSTNMSTKRKGSSVTTNYNFRPANDFQTRAEAKGTKPLPSPISVRGALLNMLLFACRKVLFFNTNIKVALYAAILFLSFIGDMTPFPRSYFSQSSNFLNQYFVKLGWAWTLICTVPFVLLTSFTYCCGNRRMVGWHVARMGVATVMWFCFTKSFAYLENNTGRCSMKGEKFDSKQTCLSAGHFWHSLDISGHAFILIYSALVMIEEARAICGWDTIQDMLRNEDHQRRVVGETDLSSPLKNLSKEELGILKLSFKTFTPYVRGLLIAMTLLTCLWDVMIVSTALYFHTMVEKLVAGILAIAVWFVTYKYWYSKTKFLPYCPGQGVFQYNKPKLNGNGASRGPTVSRSRSDQGSTFLGMPLYGARGDNLQEEEIATVTKLGASAYRGATSATNPRLGPITKSQGRPDMA